MRLIHNKCVYFHLDDGGKVFYIGIGNPERPYKKDRRSVFWKNYVEKHCVSGFPKVMLVHKNIDWASAVEHEQYWIACYGRRDLGRGALVNLTDGGEGTQRKSVSDETRAKLSTSKKGQASRKGAVLSNETKQKISNSNRGKVRSDEVKALIAVKSRGRKKSEETRKKIGDIHRGKIVSQETRDKIRASKVGSCRPSEASEKQSNSMRGRGKGYYFNKASGKYYSYITIKQIFYHLGCFLTEAQARAAYLTALENYRQYGILPQKENLQNSIRKF